MQFWLPPTHHTCSFCTTLQGQPGKDGLNGRNGPQGEKVRIWETVERQLNNTLHMYYDIFAFLMQLCVNLYVERIRRRKCSQLWVSRLGADHQAFIRCVDKCFASCGCKCVKTFISWINGQKWLFVSEMNHFCVAGRAWSSRYPRQPRPEGSEGRGWSSGTGRTWRTSWPSGEKRRNLVKCFFCVCDLNKRERERERERESRITCVASRS